ncbi:RNA-directed DNA polymerase [Aeromonas enteropelogenes]|uniref:RNA-directed DNA polymerase n=1 Tax=Aeromonas enteropelogenes TaxID=29489 RepID=UPI003BA391C9
MNKLQDSFIKKDFISIDDLYNAYRKAKQEAFFDQFYPSKHSFLDFEKDLDRNLQSLLAELLSPLGDPWWSDAASLGSYFYVPKSIDDSLFKIEDDSHFCSVDPIEDWNRRCRQSKNKASATYRLIVDAKVKWHVISALWIIKVGYKYESVTDPKTSYGNRLRIKNNKIDGAFETSINTDSHALFLPYYPAYKKWRGNGLNVMKQQLSNGKDITAITMDIAGFYHNSSPRFLTDERFLRKACISLSQDELQFTKQLIASINTWYKSTPDYKHRGNGALPVGLSASKVISNCLLFELDINIKKHLSPLYYGRYVDDLFIVLKTDRSFKDSESILRFFTKKIQNLSLTRHNKKIDGLKIRFEYASDCDLKLSSKKQKIFQLSSQHGLDLVHQISSQIREQSSEYRMLPNLPSSSTKMAEKTLLANSDASLTADALRKADVVSIRRLGLSLLIRDVEAYSNSLNPEEWQNIRKEFYGLSHRYLLTPKGFFEFSNYYSRVFQVMVQNLDFEEAHSFLKSLKKTFKIIYRTTTSNISTQETRTCERYFAYTLYEIAIRTCTNNLFSAWDMLAKIINAIELLIHPLPAHEYSTKQLCHAILRSDLAITPYKRHWIYEQKEDYNSDFNSLNEQDKNRLSYIYKFQKHSRVKKPDPKAMLFPTRPLTVQEIVLACPETLSDNELFKSFIFAFRGAKTSNISPVGMIDNNEIHVPHKSKDKVKVAITNFEVTNAQYLSSLKGELLDLSLDRFEKINTLINNIMETKERVDYIVFPECAIPLPWAINIAVKLSHKGISFISGIEYHSKRTYGSKTTIRNDCLISLITKWPYYTTSFLFLQPKLNPAHGERKQLRENKLELYTPSEKERLPVYHHGNYIFGILICSDLTSPHNRVRYQGEVDSLFVLEWNKDINTFGYLVESASHDIHTFIIQVNNRLYGDSRVRTPYSKSHMRDAVRIKGGISDYFIIAEIDYIPLRKYQKSHFVNDTEDNGENLFKPIPIGFSMSDKRKSK